MMESSERCTMCGTADWEWDEDKFAYVPETKVCRGCYNKAQATDQHDKTMPGTTVILVKNTAQKRAERFVADRKQAAERVAERRAARRARDKVVTQAFSLGKE